MIVPDLVGHGRSEVPDDPVFYRVEAMADQVIALADVLGCDTFHLVGYSMGGRVALAVGCTYPRLLRSFDSHRGHGRNRGFTEAPPPSRRRYEECLSVLSLIFLLSLMNGWLFHCSLVRQCWGVQHQQISRTQRAGVRSQWLSSEFALRRHQCNATSATATRELRYAQPC